MLANSALWGYLIKPLKDEKEGPQNTQNTQKKEELGKISDETFNERKVNVPWMPFPMTLLEYMMQAMEHVSNHRMQLFIWLKLSGEKLNTGHLYGMP